MASIHEDQHLLFDLLVLAIHHEQYVALIAAQPLRDILLLAFQTVLYPCELF
mgnify:FL=1